MVGCWLASSHTLCKTEVLRAAVLNVGIECSVAPCWPPLTKIRQQHLGEVSREDRCPKMHSQCYRARCKYLQKGKEIRMDPVAFSHFLFYGYGLVTTE